MADSDLQLPKFSKQQSISARAHKALSALTPGSWLLTSLSGEADFGLDYEVQLVSEGLVQFPFHLQLKGTENPSWAQDGELSFALKTATLNYYLQTAQPVLLVVVDLSIDPDPVKCQAYFAWAQDLARELLQPGERLLTGQDTFTVRIQAQNKITNATDLAPELRRRIEEFHALQSLGERVNAVVPQATHAERLLALEQIERHIAREGRTFLDLPELDPTSALPRAAPETFAGRLQSVADLVSTGDTDRASSLLTELKTDAVGARAEERAEFHFLKGKVATATYDFQRAVVETEKAVRLSPATERYRVELIDAKFLLEHTVDEPRTYAHLISELQGCISDAASSMRARLHLAAQDYNAAEAAIANLSLEKSIGTKAMILLLRGRWDELLTVTEPWVTSASTKPSLALVLRVFRTRAAFNRAIRQDHDADAERLEFFGPPNIDLKSLHLAWAEVETTLGLAERLGWPRPVDFFFDILIAMAGMLNYQERIYPTVRRAADFRRKSESLQLALFRSAFAVSNVDGCTEAARRLEQLGSRVEYRAALVVALGESGNLAECVDRAISLVREGRHGEAMFFPAIGTALLAADRLLRANDAAVLQNSLNAHAQAGTEGPLFEYLRRVQQSPLERDEALTDLISAWERNRSRLIGIRLLEELNAKDGAQAERCIKVGEELRRSTRLPPPLVVQLSQAYNTLERWVEMRTLVDDSLTQFPSNPTLLAVKALALEHDGHTGEALDILGKLIEAGASDRFAMHAYINIAARCGLLVQAISLLQQLVARETERDKRIALLHLLFVLESERDPASGTLLPICIRMGADSRRDNELEEGLYLLAFVMATLHDSNKPTPSQVEEFNTRARAFSDLFPRSDIFRMIEFRKDGTDLADVLAAAGLGRDQRPPELVRLGELLKRGTGFPYAWRPKRLLPGISDLAELWELTKTTRDQPEYELVMTKGEVASSERPVRFDRTPVLDLISLFVLHDLGLLEVLFSLFAKIAVSKLSVVRLRQLAHPLSGTTRPATVRGVLAALTAHLRQVEQPGTMSVPKAVGEMRAAVEADQERLLAGGQYCLFCDDAIYLQVLSTKSQNFLATNTPELLVFADQQGVLTPREVALKLAKLLGWNIGRVPIRDRYLVAGMADELEQHKRVEDLDAALARSSARALYDALWSPRMAYGDTVIHISRLLLILARQEVISEDAIATVWRNWYIKAKLRTDINILPFRHLAFALIAAARNLSNRDEQVIRRLWRAYLDVVIQEWGDRMDTAKEDEAIRLIAEVACFGWSERPEDAERRLLASSAYTNLKRGFTEGTHQEEVFRGAFERQSILAAAGRDGSRPG